MYLFTSESVSEGHPDKVADQISDALLDQFLAYDEKSHCAIETFVTTGQVVIMGEVSSKEYVDLQTIARRTINRIGYTKSEYQFDGNSCGIMTAIHEQSGDINQGVSRAEEDEQGAGDQGMMFGYATTETDRYIPVSLDIAHLIMKTLAEIRKEGREMLYLRPDSKSQVTVEYSDEGVPQRIDTIVVSTQHDDFDEDEAMLAKIREDVLNILMPRVKAQLRSEKMLALFNDDIKYFVNPTGKFVIGGASTATQDSPVAKSLSTLTAARERTAAEPSPARTLPRLTALRHTLRAISPRTWWLPVLPTRCLCSSPTPSVWHSL